jgi:hypothetical protein
VKQSTPPEDFYEWAEWSDMRERLAKEERARRFKKKQKARAKRKTTGR